MTMSPQDAMHSLCHEYPHGGLVALAARLDMPQQTLRNKATLDRTDGEPRNSEFKLSEMARINRMCNSLALAQSFAADVGAVVLRLPEIDAVGDAALLELVLAANREYGEMCAALNDAIADGEIQRHEYEKLRRETLESVRAQLELLDRANALVVESPRRRLQQVKR